MEGDRVKEVIQFAVKVFNEYGNLDNVGEKKEEDADNNKSKNEQFNNEDENKGESQGCSGYMKNAHYNRNSFE